MNSIFGMFLIWDYFYIGMLRQECEAIQRVNPTQLQIGTTLSDLLNQLK